MAKGAKHSAEREPTVYSVEEYGRIRNIPNGRVAAYKVWSKSNLEAKSLPAWDSEFKEFQNRKI